MDELHYNAYQALQTALDSRDNGGDYSYDAKSSEHG
jgi:hypothetical protein